MATPFFLGHPDMDRTLIAVHNTLAAIHAPAYDIGILTDRGMLPGLANLSAANVLSRLPLLKAHNAQGAHIYIRPSGEHRFTVLDDLSQNSVDRLAADGYEPCAVVETSPGNFQAWLKHDDVYPAHLSTFVAQTLAQRYQADPSAADWRRFGRLPGFTNCKPKYRQSNGLYPYVLLKRWTGEQHSMASYLRLEMTKLYQLQQQERQARIAQHQAAVFPHRGGRGIPAFPLSGSVTPRSTTTVPPPPTSPFASPPTRLRCRRMRSPAPSTASTSPAIRIPPSGLPTSSGRWRRRDHGRNARRLECPRLSAVVHPTLCGVRTIQFPSARPPQSRRINEEVEHAAPFPFAFLVAFSVPRSEHPRPSDARSPSRHSLRAFQVWTPPPRQARVPFHKSLPLALGVGRVGTPSGQACTASSGQTSKNGAKHMFNKVILIGRLGKNAEVKTAQNKKEFVVLNVATSESWKNEKGEYDTRTEWHRVYAWGTLANFAKTLQKGQLINLEGKIKYRTVEKMSRVRRSSTPSRRSKLRA